MSAPGTLTWMQPATGLLRLGVSINGFRAVVEDCTVDWPQNVEPVHLIQGGPWASAVDIGDRHVSFSISMPLRLDRDGDIEAAAWALLDAAQQGVPMRIDTNHALAHSYLTAEGNASDRNELLSFDTAVVRTLKLTADESKGVSITAELEGRVDGREASAFSIPNDSYLRGGRVVGFNECRCSKFYSSLRSAMKLEVSIENKVEFAEFIPPITADNRDPNQNQGKSFPGEPNYAFMPDQSGAVGVSTSKFTGTYEEMSRLGADRESYVHGGFNWRKDGSVRDDLVFTFGPLTASVASPVYSPTQQKLGASLVRRTVKFLALTPPYGATFFAVN